MAESAELGKLIVKISTDVSDLKKGMDDAKKQATSFSGDMSKIFKGIGFALVANEFRKITEETLKFGQELHKLSQQTGLTATQVGSLKFAAEKSNTSIEAVSGAVRNLSRVMLAASQGNKEARQTFDQFQISYRNADGTLRDTSAVMLEIADRIKNTDNQTLALSASQKLLGKSAQETFAFFKQGSKDIQAAQEEFKKMVGQHANLDDFAKKSDELDAKWKKVGLQFRLIAVDLVTELMPTLERIMDLFSDIASSDRWSGLREVLKFLLDTFNQILDTIGQIPDAMNAIMGNKAAPNGGLLAGEDLGKIAQNRKDIIDRFYGGKDPGAGTITQMPDSSPTVLDEVVSTAPREKDAKGIKDSVQEASTAMEDLAKKWSNVNKEIQDALASTLQAIATGFGTAIAEVIVDGKDFGEAMKELWKDIAKTIIAEVVRIIAQLIILFVWQQLTGQTGGGGKGITKFFGFRDGGVIGGRAPVHARNGLMTGPFGEGGIPAVVHPNEIITPIDKFFDFVKDASKSSPVNITINAGDRDPREIAMAVQLEVDRKRRNV